MALVPDASVALIGVAYCVAQNIVAYNSVAVVRVVVAAAGAVIDAKALVGRSFVARW